MDNYICINGQRIDLTPETLSKINNAIHKELEVDIFNRQYNQLYYFIDMNGQIRSNLEKNDSMDDVHYNMANYCTDASLMEQRSLHELLNRRLWRFAMTHGETKNSWNSSDAHWCIYYDINLNKYYINDFYVTIGPGIIYFSSEEVAKQAIEEIIKPFLKEYPNFKW